MKKIYILILSSVLVLGAGVGIHAWTSSQTVRYTKPPKRTRIDEAIAWRKEVTKDPALGYVPYDRMMAVYDRIAQLQRSAALRNSILPNVRWRERGPYSVAGRTRGILIDKGDPTGETVFTAGVTGGLWKTTKISDPYPEWVDIGHFFDNINISAIGQYAADPDVMYFGTGEPHAAAGRGLGIWKSTDGGDSWTHLPSTINSDFYFVVRLFVHPTTGDVYAGTESGLRRSQDGGQTWQKVLGIGASGGTSDNITDIEFASDGAIYVSVGHGTGNSNIFRSDAGPNQGNLNNWTYLTGPTSGFPGGRTRTEIAVAPSNSAVIYALTAVGGNASGIYKSINRGANWTLTSEAPPAFGMANFARGQAWYDLTICVNPSNENNIIIGGIDLLMSTNGGVNWQQISQWFGGGGFQYVHADQHEILWDRDRPNRVFFGNDGGIYLSNNGGVTINNRNNGYNVTQFYGLAVHPDTFSNYFLAGSQDNGTQQFDDFRIAETVEVLGGDGFMCHIDQDNPDIQLVSLYYGNWRISLDGGVNGAQSFGPIRQNGDVGSGFFTPSDWDNDADILYTQGAGNGQYFRWKLSEMGSSNGDFVTLTNANVPVRHVYASDHVPNRIYIGSTSGRVYRIDDAHEGLAKTPILFNLPTGGSVSCVQEANGDANHIVVTLSSYGVTSVWETRDGGTTWASIEGDLPDMPVNWAAFHPTDNDQLLLATDAGIWVTEDIDGNNTNWLISTQMPVVRTDMLQIRPSDGLVAAGTYGRGIFTTDFLSPSIPRFDVERVAYLQTNTQVEDYSINPQSWRWDFGNGAVSTDPEPSYQYTSVGTYNLTLTINDTASTSDVVQVLPDRSVPYTLASPIYGGHFEGTYEDFGVDTKAGTSWERGSSTVFGKDGTNSGSNAWVTGLSSQFYDDNTETYLYTPNYDLTDPAIYELKFMAKFNIQDGFDGMQVQYSTDRGQTWRPLGRHNPDLDSDANKWYNYTSNSNLTAFDNGQSYFTGYQAVWKEFKTDLNNLVGQPNVAFRFAFKSNGSNRRAGVALDDVQVTKYDDILETVLRSWEGQFVTPNGDEIALTWTTQPEYRCKHFKISESENGRDFTEYGFAVPGQGSTADVSSYSYNPLNKFRDLYYFKLKVVDFDDNFFESDIIVVKRGAVAGEVPLEVSKIFPNPFSNYLDLSFNQVIDRKIVVNLYDAAGRLVLSEGHVPNGVYLRINTQALQAGMYFLTVGDGDQKVTYKVLKH